MSVVESGDPTEERHGRLTGWMLGVAGVTFLAGLLFGYDLATAVNWGAASS